MFEIRPDGLYLIKSNHPPLFICGNLQVLAIGRAYAQLHSYGLVIEWTNIDDRSIKKFIPMRWLYGENLKLLKDLLLDSGFKIANLKNIWELISQYLHECTSVPIRALVTETTGWLGQSFATAGWSVNFRTDELLYIGTTVDQLQQRSSLHSWQQHVGRLCEGNPLMVFACCTALAAPLLHWLNWDSSGFHLVGNSKSGKTTLLALSASILSDRTYCYSWRATANGLEAIATSRNDMLLCLDELHQASPEEVDQAIYMLANGVSKIRGSKEGFAAKTNRWRLGFLSTGEIGLSETLAQIQKTVRAGQEVRFIELPVTRQYGAFDNLHSAGSAKEFAETLDQNMTNNHGCVFPAWIEYLSQQQDLRELLRIELAKIRHQLSKKYQGNQTGYALDRFALLALAGELAIAAGIMPWASNEAINSMQNLYECWLDNRGHSHDSEEHTLRRILANALPSWELGLVEPLKALLDGEIGYIVNDNNECEWYLTKPAFKDGLQIHFRSQLTQRAHMMQQRQWLSSNEGAGRFEFKRQFPGGKPHDRYYRIFPSRIIRDLHLNFQFSQNQQ